MTSLIDKIEKLIKREKTTPERKQKDDATKSSSEILSELFSAFNADPPKIEEVATKKSKKSKKKHKKEKKKRSRSSSSSSDSDGSDYNHKKKKRKKSKSKKRKDRSPSTPRSRTPVRIKHEPESIKIKNENTIKKEDNRKEPDVKEPRIKQEFKKQISVKSETTDGGNVIDTSLIPMPESPKEKLDPNDLRVKLENKKNENAECDKSKGKIQIKNLKFSTVFEEAVKQAEEEARKKAEKYEDGEYTDSSSGSVKEVVPNLQFPKTSDPGGILKKQAAAESKLFDQSAIMESEDQPEMEIRMESGYEVEYLDHTYALHAETNDAMIQEVEIVGAIAEMQEVEIAPPLVETVAAGNDPVQIIVGPDNNLMVRDEFGNLVDWNPVSIPILATPWASLAGTPTNTPRRKTPRGSTSVPAVATPTSSSQCSSATSSSAPRRSMRARRGVGHRHRIALPDNIIISYLEADSGSEYEGSDVDDDAEDHDELLDTNTERLRTAARELLEYAEEVGVVEKQQEVEAEADEADHLFIAGGAALADLGPNASDEFHWSTDFGTFNGAAEEYRRSPGPVLAIQNPVEMFLEIWNDVVMSMIVEQTNYYAWQYIAALSERDDLPKHLDQWQETTIEEMYRYFAIIILMGMCNRGSQRLYWTTGLLEMPKFRVVMSRNRFELISRFLHFVNNENIPHNVRSYARKISKIAPLLDHCNQKFSSLYTPQRELSLDESLLLWKGRLSWVQCIRTKAARFGIKSFELCEASTGYMLRCIIYTGKNSSIHEGPIHGFANPTAKVVLELMNGYLDVGHLLVMDNWYNQLVLTRYLKMRHTDVIGTLNRRRKHVPEMIRNVNDRQMPHGDKISCHCGDMSLTSWKDVKLVTVISTYHADEMVAGMRAGDKPVAVADYNKYMGGVDLKDQKLSMYLLERKRGLKWYIKVFRRLLNTSILNAYIMYHKNPMYKVLTHREFRMQLAEGLIERFSLNTGDVARSLPQSSFVAATGGRFDSRLPHCSVHTEHQSATNLRLKVRRCVQCSARGVIRKVTTQCKICDVGLCLGQCFLDYHKQQ